MNRIKTEAKQIKTKTRFCFILCLLLICAAGLAGCGAKENTKLSAETEFAADYLRGVYIEIAPMKGYPDTPPVMDIDDENAQYVMNWKKTISPGFSCYDTSKKGGNIEVLDCHVFLNRTMLFRVDLEIEIIKPDGLQDCIINVYQIFQKESGGLYLGERVWAARVYPNQKVVQPVSGTSYINQHLTRSKIIYGELTEETYDYNLSIFYAH